MRITEWAVEVHKIGYTIKDADKNEISGEWSVTLSRVDGNYTAIGYGKTFDDAKENSIRCAKRHAIEVLP